MDVGVAVGVVVEWWEWRCGGVWAAACMMKSGVRAVSARQMKADSPRMARPYVGSSESSTRMMEGVSGERTKSGCPMLTGCVGSDSSVSVLGRM